MTLYWLTSLQTVYEFVSVIFDLGTITIYEKKQIIMKFYAIFTYTFPTPFRLFRDADESMLPELIPPIESKIFCLFWICFSIFDFFIKN